jgi:putative membrane protein
MDGNWWLAMGAGMLLWIVLTVAIVLLVVRYLDRPSGARGGSSDPEQILRERFARGEIDEDELQKRLTSLRSA